jgi:hypothetical protein
MQGGWWMDWDLEGASLFLTQLMCNKRSKKTRVLTETKEKSRRQLTSPVPPYVLCLAPEWSHPTFKKISCCHPTKFEQSIHFVGTLIYHKFNPISLNRGCGNHHPLVCLHLRVRWCATTTLQIQPQWKERGGAKPRHWQWGGGWMICSTSAPYKPFTCTC